MALAHELTRSRQSTTCVPERRFRFSLTAPYVALSTEITSVRMKDYQLRISDIFGGNAFLPLLFLLAVLISGKVVLPDAQASDIYPAGLGILLSPRMDELPCLTGRLG